MVHDNSNDIATRVLEAPRQTDIEDVSTHKITNVSLSTLGRDIIHPLKIRHQRRYIRAIFQSREVVFQSRRATREKNSIRFPMDGADHRGSSPRPAIYYLIIVARTYICRMRALRVDDTS